VLANGGEALAIQRQTDLGDDVRRQRSRDGAVPLERKRDRSLARIALDAGAVDAKLDVEMTNAARRLGPPLRRDVNRHPLDGRFALGDDIEDVDSRTRRDRVEQRLDRTGRFLGGDVDAVRSAGWSGIEQSLAAPRDLGARDDGSRGGRGSRRGCFCWRRHV